MAFYTLNELPAARPAAGVTRRAVFLDQLMLTFFEFEAGAPVPAHAHPHEQITYVVRGALRFTLGEETRDLHAGEGCTVPANATHSAVALEPTQVIDGWSPVREDYK